MKETVAVAFIVVILATGGIMALSSYVVPSSTSPNYLAGPTKLSEINPQTALRFTMALNSSSVRGGDVLGVSLSLSNTISKTNNVTGAAYWRLTNESENSGSVGWNCAQNDVFRIEVVRGYYDLNNFSRGAPLDVFVWQPPFGFNQCPGYVRSANWTAPVPSVPWQGENYYIFRPSSNVAWWVTSSELRAPCLPSNETYRPCGRPGQEAVMNETMILRTAQFADSTGVFTVIGGDEWGDLEVTHFYVGPSTIRTTSSSTAAAIGPTYTINGLTCHVPVAYQSYPSVIHLLPLVTTNPRFLNVTAGMPFVLGNAENITDRVQQIGNQPSVHLPDALEMVFYSIGPTTTCGMFQNGFKNIIVAQVPIQNGGYNMTGATFNGLPD